jgi:hypothetical protein
MHEARKGEENVHKFFLRSTTLPDIILQKEKRINNYAC